VHLLIRLARDFTREYSSLATNLRMKTLFWCSKSARRQYAIVERWTLDDHDCMSHITCILLVVAALLLFSVGGWAVIYVSKRWQESVEGGLYVAETDDVERNHNWPSQHLKERSRAPPYSQSKLHTSN
jgi:hypothetical protein